MEEVEAEELYMENVYISQVCPCCEEKTNIANFTQIKEYEYFRCGNCGSIFIDTKYINCMDEGKYLVEYNEMYWKDELSSAKQRAYSAAMARMAEVIYYARIPIKKFLDIGTGPGYFLDAVAKYLPDNANVFYGVEKFPPPQEHRTKSAHYINEELASIKDIKFDAGMCMEVIEHLTPKMLKNLFKDLSKVSNEGAIYIFNTGLPRYVMKEDMGYLDPLIRGHIMSYSIKALGILAEEYGFTVFPLKGKDWAFIIEYKSKSNSSEELLHRIWTALEANVNILTDSEMGSVLRVLGLETARAY